MRLAKAAMAARLICTLLVLNLLSGAQSYPSGAGLSEQSLECHTCYSQRSWGDCLSKDSVSNCPSFLDTCLTVHRVARHHDGRIVHEFAKSCFSKDMCTRSFCQQGTTNETQVTCRELNCCSTPLCNKGVPVRATVARRY